jgi:hypothetical protein
MIPVRNSGQESGKYPQAQLGFLAPVSEINCFRNAKSLKFRLCSFN